VRLIDRPLEVLSVHQIAHQKEACPHRLDLRNMHSRCIAPPSRFRGTELGLQNPTTAICSHTKKGLIYLRHPHSRLSCGTLTSLPQLQHHHGRLSCGTLIVASTAAPSLSQTALCASAWFVLNHVLITPNVLACTSAHVTTHKLVRAHYPRVSLPIVSLTLLLMSLHFRALI
jgi:hypothetical protein